MKEIIEEIIKYIVNSLFIDKIPLNIRFNFNKDNIKISEENSIIVIDINKNLEFFLQNLYNFLINFFHDFSDFIIFFFFNIMNNNNYKFNLYLLILKNEYMLLIYILIFILIFVIFLLGIVIFLNNKTYDYEKNTPYECGFNPFEDAREPFEIHFYLIAIFFIIFDIEISFLVPFVLVFRLIGFFGFIIIILFLIILMIGFVYEIIKGGLEWN